MYALTAEYWKPSKEMEYDLAFINSAKWIKRSNFSQQWTQVDAKLW